MDELDEKHRENPFKKYEAEGGDLSGIAAKDGNADKAASVNKSETETEVKSDSRLDAKQEGNGGENPQTADKNADDGDKKADGSDKPE